MIARLLTALIFTATVVVSASAQSPHALFAEGATTPIADPLVVEATPPPPPALANPLEDYLKPSFRIRGLIETEAAMSAQTPQSRAVIGDILNGYGFRRVRLGAQGTIGDTTRWISEVELAGGRLQLLDVFIGLNAIPGVRELRIGHFREPFSLEGMTGVPFLTFMERSPMNILDPARNWGVCGYWWPDSERLVYALGVFRDGSDNSGNSVGNENAWAYTTRLTGLPIDEPEGETVRLMHMGGAFSYRNPAGGIVSFNPGVVPNLLAVVDNPDSPFLPLVNIPAITQQIYNLQAATVNGSFSLQAEWFATDIHTPDLRTVFLHGYYVQASYFLTGEHRGYDRTRGAFSQVNVLRPVTKSGGGFGAVELAARYSFYNFDSPNMPPSPDGLSSRALLNQMELGVNWYLNDFTRMMVNYTLPFVKKPGLESTSLNVFSVRAGLYW